MADAPSATMLQKTTSRTQTVDVHRGVIFLIPLLDAPLDKALRAGFVPPVEAEVWIPPHTVKGVGCGAPGWDKHVYLKPHAFGYEFMIPKLKSKHNIRLLKESGPGLGDKLALGHIELLTPGLFCFSCCCLQF